jgi:hypothetical protein
MGELRVTKFMAPSKLWFMNGQRGAFTGSKR